MAVLARPLHSEHLLKNTQQLIKRNLRQSSSLFDETFPAQLQSAAGGVGEEESGLRNKESSLELRSFSRLVSRLSCSVSFSIRCLSFLKAFMRLS